MPATSTITLRCASDAFAGCDQFRLSDPLPSAKVRKSKVISFWESYCPCVVLISALCTILAYVLPVKLAIQTLLLFLCCSGFVYSVIWRTDLSVWNQKVTLLLLSRGCPTLNVHTGMNVTDRYVFPCIAAGRKLMQKVLMMMLIHYNMWSFCD